MLASVGRRLNSTTSVRRSDPQRGRFMDICKRETYGIRMCDLVAGEGPSNRPNNRSATVRTLRRTTSYVDDQDQNFVGFQDVVESLIAELLRSRACEVSSPFMLPKACWICVSQDYNTPDLLSILKIYQGCNKEILETLERMTESDLESHLRSLLKNQKYLVVVDDGIERA
ncbi:hypothetical protein HAX54_050705 [Datura stramonium]|uniref:Uncharacterized protein n=1 Tax=Datura stramonium TaxID=4076 RepID=A0ABS8WQH1_DATST|nr:hypothetical protein [Datura stramonium]